MVPTTTSSCEGIMPQTAYYGDITFNINVDGLFLLLAVGVVAVLCVALRKFLNRFLTTPRLRLGYSAALR